MKKITLMMLLALGLYNAGYGQATYTIVAPDDLGATSSLRAPNGTSVHAYQRSVMYIHPYEMLPMNSSSITSVGFQYLQGTGSAPVIGNFTLYLQNTTSFAYAKGATFSGALTGMSAAYIGTYTVPAAAGAATITLPLTTPFNFTGDGLYVAWEFESTGPFATTAASLASCNQFNGQAELWIGSANSAAAPATNTLAGSNFRPALIFNAINTATNEVEVIDIIAPGKVAKLFNTPQTIISNIVNSSIGAQNNVTITLNATGANPFTDTQVINMAAGSVSTLTFSAYNPTATGMSTITISSSLSDQNTANNTKTWTQSVTCNEIAQNAPATTFNSSFGYGGSSGSGCFLAKHFVPTTASLTTINVAIGSATSNTRTAYGVLVDGTGAIMATSSNTVTLAPSTIASFSFSNVQLAGGTSYYMGIAQPTSGYYPLAYVTNTVFVPPVYYSVPLAGGTIAQASSDGYFGIEPVLSFSNVAISALASKTVVCKKDGPNTVTLTASGLSTYTWVPSGTGPTIAVTPTVSGVSGAVIYYVSGTDAATGCKSNLASVTISVSACNGLADNDSDGFNINLFPNPAANGKSTISGLVGVNVVSVFNMAGQLISTNTVSDEFANIDLSNQAAGNYLVKITDKTSGKTRMVKLVN